MPEVPANPPAPSGSLTITILPNAEGAPGSAVCDLQHCTPFQIGTIFGRAAVALLHALAVACEQFERSGDVAGQAMVQAAYEEALTEPIDLASARANLSTAPRKH